MRKRKCHIFRCGVIFGDEWINTYFFKRGCMQRKELLEIAEQFSAYDVRFSDKREGFDIVNPFGKDPIHVECEGELLSAPYIVWCSVYHVHLETEDQVIKFVSDIIEGRTLIISLFKDDHLCMSADLDSQELRDLSYTMLSKHFGFDGRLTPYGTRGKLIDRADSFKIRGWAQDADFEAKFITDEQGNVSIQVIRES